MDYFISVMIMEMSLISCFLCSQTALVATAMRRVIVRLKLFYVSSGQALPVAVSLSVLATSP